MLTDCSTQVAAEAIPNPDTGTPRRLVKKTGVGEEVALEETSRNSDNQKKEHPEVRRGTGH